MQKVGSALTEMVRRVEGARERAARRGNLHPTDFACIGYLKRQNRPLSPKEIIGYLGLSSGSGTALLDRLEAMGYIHRQPNPDDRRGVLIALDEVGAKEPLALYARVQQQFLETTESFSDRDLEVIAEFLERLSAMQSSSDS